MGELPHKFDVKTDSIASLYAVSMFCRDESARLKILSDEERGAGNEAEFKATEKQRDALFLLRVMCEDEIEERISNYLTIRLS